MAALQIVAAAHGASAGLPYVDNLDSFEAELPKSLVRGSFASSTAPSLVLLPRVLMAWNRGEGVAFSGFTAASAAGSPRDEATFRALIARQLQGLLGAAARPAWRKNHRGELALHLE